MDLLQDTLSDDGDDDDDDDVVEYTYYLNLVFISSAVLSQPTCFDVEDNQYGDVFQYHQLWTQPQILNKHYRNITTNNNAAYIASNILSYALEIAV